MAGSTADITRLRQLYAEMGHIVTAAYGQADLDLGHNFHETPQGLRFILRESARRKVLGRLLVLNHERYEEEVKVGLHEKKAKGKGTGEKKKAEKRPEGSGQMPLF